MFSVIPSEYDCPSLLSTGKHSMLGMKVYARPWRKFFKKTFYQPCKDCEYLKEVPRDWRPTYTLDF